MAVRYTFATGTAAEWAASFLILAVGQPGYDTTNKITKVGDGVSYWGDLPTQVGSSDHSVADIRSLSQAAYNLIAVKNPQTLYVITS